MTDPARRLAEARLTGALVEPDAATSPGDAASAYALQRAVAAHLGPMSDAWKVGSTSPESRAKLGTDEPGAARVPARHRFRSGEAMPVFAAHDLYVEAEFAPRLGRALPPRAAAYARAEVEAAIDAVAPALEIVGCRFAGGIAAAGRFRVTADGGANVALVTGAPVADWRAFDLPAHGVRLVLNGEVAAEGTGARALGDPVEVMVWLANLARRRDGLAAGEIVSTGTCTGLVRVGPGDTLAGDFGPLGAVETRLVADSPG